jgi:hypothetical protein
MNDTPVLCQIPRECIEAVDCAQIRFRFDIGTLPAASLRELFGQVIFRPVGYDSHPDELYLIPAFRRFARQWHEYQPHWLFFSALGDDSLRHCYFALLDSVESVQVDRTGLCRVVYDTGELHRLLAVDLAQSDALAERLGISAAQRLKRAMAVLRYFQIKGGVA